LQNTGIQKKEFKNETARRRGVGEIYKKKKARKKGRWWGASVRSRARTNNQD